LIAPLAIAQRNLSVHNHRANTGGITERLLVGGGVGDLRGVEDTMSARGRRPGAPGRSDETRDAGSAVILRMACSSVSAFRSRTYLAITRGKEPAPRGCGLPRRVGPSMANAPPSLQTIRRMGEDPVEIVLAHRNPTMPTLPLFRRSIVTVRSYDPPKPFA